MKDGTEDVSKMKRVSAKHSREYDEFLKGEEKEKKLGLYERSCGFAEKALPIPPTKGLLTKYEEAIKFSHLKVTPKGAFSLMVLGSLLAFLVPMAMVVVFQQLTISTFLLILILTSVAFYYLYDYPLHFSVLFRIRASSEMVLAIVYMTISMRVSPNIENAIEFAARNLSGALREDLQQLLWDIYMRKYDSAAKGLDVFIDKWKMENKEFAESLYLIKTAVVESTQKREEILDEAVNVMLQGTRERMKHYAQDLKTPVTVLNALGILLPIIGLVFLPMIAVFMPTTVQPIFIIIGYNILLPLIVYWIMKVYLDKRPYGFHQPDISKHPLFLAEKKWTYPLIGVGIALPLILVGAYMISVSNEPFGFAHLIYSLVITLGVSGGIISYSILSVRRKIKIRKEIVQIEGEFAEVLFQLGHQIMRGIPMETTLKNITPQIKNLKISSFFAKTLYNIETFGMTLEQAVFNEENGAIKEYPSKLVNAVMRAVVQISKRGMNTASKAMITISKYLKDSNEVEEYLKEMLGEVTSTMSMQAILLAPLSSGIVVALSGMIMKMLLDLKEMIDEIYGGLSGFGPLGAAGSTMFSSILNLDKMIPVSTFQLIVSIYMIEVVGMIAIFLSIIQNGDENLLKRMELGKLLIISIAIYSMVMLLCYTIFVSIIPVMGVT
jgi:hypothetical protein